MLGSPWAMRVHMSLFETTDCASNLRRCLCRLGAFTICVFPRIYSRHYHRLRLQRLRPPRRVCRCVFPRSKTRSDIFPTNTPISFETRNSKHWGGISRDAVRAWGVILASHKTGNMCSSSAVRRSHDLL